MKKKIPMILLLSLLAPLSSCDALKNVEITAGEFPKGGKEITYLQLKEALDDTEIEEKIIPNGVKTSLTSDTISFYHMKDFNHFF